MLQREKGFYLCWLQHQSRWHRKKVLAFATIARMIFDDSFIRTFADVNVLALFY